MSGSQIGYVVGYAIGSIWGMGPIGGAIGGYIGGVIDPTQINGPHIGDGQNQTSADGVPIPWILGMAPCVGNICDNGPRYEVKQTEGGKGSTTETNTFEAHQTFVVLICESSVSRDSVIVDIAAVKCNGKLVYDVRPGSTMLAESAKWKEKVTFYFGAEDQMPDPDLEAIHGVGNTPAFRDRCVAVFKDFNRSEFGDAIPQFEWIVVSEGATVAAETSYVPGRQSGFANSHWPLTDSEGDYTYSGNWTSGLGAGIQSPEFDTIQEVLDYFGNVDAPSGDYGTPNVLGTPSQFIGYAATIAAATGVQTSTTAIDVVAAQPPADDLSKLLIIYQWALPEDGFTANDPASNAFCSLGIGPWLGAKNGWIVRRVPVRTSTAYYQITGTSCLMEAIPALCISVYRKRIPPLINGTALPDLPGWYVDPDGNFFTGYSEVFGSFTVLSEATLSGGSYIRYELGPAMLSSDPLNVEATWTAAYDAAVLNGDLPAGWTYGNQYPEAIGSVWQENAGLPPSVIDSRLSLATILQRINRRGGLTDADIDVTECTDLVIGYPITAQYTAVECMRPLCGTYFVKGSEYDGQIHFHKDGQDVVLVVDPMHFVNGTDEKDEDKRAQSVEYPRLLTASYIAPSQDFAIGKAKDERRSPDVRAIGEMEIQIPVCMDDDEAWQVTNKTMKVTWARQQGTRKFTLPFAYGDANYLQMVPCIPFALEGKRYIVDQMTINQRTIDIEASYDRQSAFTSNVTAIPTLPPTKPPSTIFGATIIAIMSLPQLRPGETPPGLYFAACGVLSNWPGCQVLISFDGGETYQNGPRITKAAVLGSLTADITADGSNAEPIEVEVINGDMVSVTDAQFNSGANGFAMVDADDVWEVGRFKTADEVTPKNYSLTDVTRGDLLTIPVDHVIGQRFAMLANAVFWPIDQEFAGQTLYVKPVTFGTDPALTEIYEVVYNPDLDVIVDGGGD